MIMTLYNCATYEKKMIKDNVLILNEKSLTNLNGYYEVKPQNKYDYQGELVNNTIPDYSILPEYLRLMSIREDTLSTDYYVKVEVVDATTIHCELKRQDLIIDKMIISGKLKKNGMFHFKDNPVDCKGIPYLIGGCSDSKTRMGLNKDGNLFIEYAYFNGGAFLLIFGDARGYNNAYTFDRTTHAFQND